jgi:hypothetical protein
MNATTFKSASAAEAVLTRAVGAERAADSVKAADHRPDGTVMVYGVSRGWLIDSGACTHVEVNGHYHWPELA